MSWRQVTAREPARAEGPNTVGILVGHLRVKIRLRVARSDRHDVADLGEELFPALVGEGFARWTSLDRTAPSFRIAKIRVARIGREIGMPRQPFGSELSRHQLMKPRIAGIVAHHWHWALQVEPQHRL